MKQFPNKVRYKKMHKPNKGYLRLECKTLFFPRDGIWALKSAEGGRVTYKQVEAARKTIRRTMSKLSLIYIRLFTGVSITKKSFGMRMGKGKGSHNLWVCLVKKGQILFEVNLKRVINRVIRMRLKYLP